MSIAQSPPAVSLREVAQQAWERQQAEAAERRRQDLEEARAKLVSAARHCLKQVFGRSPHDPFSPYGPLDFRAARFEILSTDDLIGSTEAVVGVTFAGETFEYRSERDGDPHELYHVWTCPTCGERWELPTTANMIGSLADLGAWLAYAPTVHRCGEAS